ncbi:MAG: heme-copper oxidase subunit III [Candidatus Marinimicrobia bacterium]|jgi:cytochrome c oxidase subunit 3|nr:heme-copper oxidase subunit III [Candidatus Neomarinimicrobiota bacterium]|tara:strand:- start:602 stop:1186 length:585 start_codon:yes stop_codon:yes gene_type:complete
MQTITTIKSVPKQTDDWFTSYLGMLISLGSFSMLFIALLASYAILRVQAGSWMSNNMSALSMALGWLNTGMLLLSSISYFMVSRSTKKRNKAIIQRFLNTTITIGFIFLILQLTLWYTLNQDGYSIISHIEGSVFYMLSGLHGLHIVGGIIALFWLNYKINNLVNYLQQVKLVGMFWHFLTVIWVVIFITVILI